MGGRASSTGFFQTCNPDRGKACTHGAKHKGHWSFKVPTCSHKQVVRCMNLIDEPGSFTAWGPGNPLTFVFGRNPAIGANPPVINKLKTMLGHHGLGILVARDATPCLFDPYQLRLKTHKHVGNLLQDTLLALVFVFVLISWEILNRMLGPMVGSIVTMPKMYDAQLLSLFLIQVGFYFKDPGNP